jgi:hypothetical protein
MTLWSAVQDDPHEGRAELLGVGTQPFFDTPGNESPGFPADCCKELARGVR